MERNNTLRKIGRLSKNAKASAFTSFVFVALTAVCFAITAGSSPTAGSWPIVWKPGSKSFIQKSGAQVLGNPTVNKNYHKKALAFDGVDDGLVLSKNPVEGQEQFTVEALFMPMADGPKAPRFIHFEDALGNRGTLEIRVTPDGQWYADTFLKNGVTGKGLTLIDSTNLHPCNKWYWLALAYDGEKMSHFVNGVKELEGKVEFVPMSAGKISLGVRLNKVNWFKGLIGEVRFHPTALDGLSLQRYDSGNKAELKSKD